MVRLSPVWRQVKLGIITKVLLHNVLVISLLLYGCETWTLPVADEMKLEAFLMTCQRQISLTSHRQYSVTFFLSPLPIKHVKEVSV